MALVREMVSGTKRPVRLESRLASKTISAFIPSTRKRPRSPSERSMPARPWLPWMRLIARGCFAPFRGTIRTSSNTIGPVQPIVAAPIETSALSPGTALAMSCEILAGLEHNQGTLPSPRRIATSPAQSVVRIRDDMPCLIAAASAGEADACDGPFGCGIGIEKCLLKRHNCCVNRNAAAGICPVLRLGWWTHLPKLTAF